MRKKNLLSPIALKAVQRFDALFAIEREINGESAQARLAVCQQRILPMVNELDAACGQSALGYLAMPRLPRPSTTC